MLSPVKRFPVIEAAGKKGAPGKAGTLMIQMFKNYWLMKKCCTKTVQSL
jgi:hypothetical protein